MRFLRKVCPAEELHRPQFQRVRAVIAFFVGQREMVKYFPHTGLFGKNYGDAFQFQTVQRAVVIEGFLPHDAERPVTGQDVFFRQVIQDRFGKAQSEQVFAYGESLCASVRSGRRPFHGIAAEEEHPDEAAEDQYAEERAEQRFFGDLDRRRRDGVAGFIQRMGQAVNVDEPGNDHNDHDDAEKSAGVKQRQDENGHIGADQETDGRGVLFCAGFLLHCGDPVPQADEL